jgi:hypothetical protein
MGRRGRDRIGLTTTCVMSAYHHLSCECESCSLQDVLETTLIKSVSDKIELWKIFVHVRGNMKFDEHHMKERTDQLPKIY